MSSNTGNSSDNPAQPDVKKNLWNNTEIADALSSVFAILAHDFKSPLNAMSLGMEILCPAGENTDNDTQEIAEEIRRGSGEILWIIGNLDALAALLSKNGTYSDSFSSVALNDILASKVHAIEQVQDHCSCSFRSARNAAGWGDPVVSGRIIENMLRLLLRYCQNGSEINAQTSINENGESVITAGSSTPVFIPSGNGEGFEKIRLDRGLALTYNTIAAERTGGRFNVTASEKGELTFTYILAKAPE